MKGVGGQSPSYPADVASESSTAPTTSHPRFRRGAAAGPTGRAARARVRPGRLLLHLLGPLAALSLLLPAVVGQELYRIDSVSYTHLTLPTTPYV